MRIMKQFNLEEYLKNPSRKVVTRFGNKVRIICTDAKCDHPVVALVEGRFSDYESIGRYTKDGRYYANDTTMSDLVFAPEKHEGRMNIYRNSEGGRYVLDCPIFESKEEAEKTGKRYINYMATIKIEWEE